VQFPKPLARLNPIAFVLAVSLALAAAAVGVARAAHSLHPAGDASVASMRTIVGHYRKVTWTFERAARVPRARTSYTERHTTDRRYLRWAVDRWTRRAYVARRQALTALHHRLAVRLPRPPGLRASPAASARYSRRLTISLRRIYPGHVGRRYALAHARGKALLRLWQRRSAQAALAVALHAHRAVRRPAVPVWLERAFLCIHRYEAAWDANTGNGYYGGLQMDVSFQAHYGGPYLARYGTADRWPAWAQVAAAARAYRAGRGFWPWPNTARACGLI
jgi:hypothetical protein